MILCKLLKGKPVIMLSCAPCKQLSLSKLCTVKYNTVDMKYIKVQLELENAELTPSVYKVHLTRVNLNTEPSFTHYATPTLCQMDQIYSLSHGAVNINTFRQYEEKITHHNLKLTYDCVKM